MPAHEQNTARNPNLSTIYDTFFSAFFLFPLDLFLHHHFRLTPSSWSHGDWNTSSFFRTLIHALCFDANIHAVFLCKQICKWTHRQTVNKSCSIFHRGDQQKFIQFLCTVCLGSTNKLCLCSKLKQVNLLGDLKRCQRHRNDSSVWR